MKYKPPEGAAGDETLVFWETRISLKNQVLKSIWLIEFRLFLKIKSKCGAVALTFRCGSDGNGPEKDCI